MTVSALLQIISIDTYRKYWLSINNSGQVVWEAFDDHDYEIFLYDGSKIIQLTDNERNDRKPHINDNGQVVWEADIGDIEILGIVSCRFYWPEYLLVF